MNTTPLAALPELIDHRAQLHGRLRERKMESAGAAPLQGATTLDRLLGRQAESDLIASFLADAADGGRGLLIVDGLATSWGPTPSADLDGFAKGIRFRIP